jgi:hypothetical protein
MVAIALVLLGLTLLAIAFVSGDPIAIACGPDGCRVIERTPSVRWLTGAVTAFTGAGLLWLFTAQLQRRR